MARKKKTRTSNVAFDSWMKPDFTQLVRTRDDYSAKFQMAMSYAHFELSAISLKKEVVKYITNLDKKHSLLDRIKDMNENRFTTVGKYMYIINSGGEIPEDVSKNLMSTLEKTVNEEEKKDDADRVRKTEQDIGPIKRKTTIQDRLETKAKEVASEIDGWIDNFCYNKKSEIKAVEDFVNLFKINELKSQHMKYVELSFIKPAKEIELAVEGKDKDLVEGYSNFSKNELKKLDQLYKNLFNACNMLQEVAKVERAPRKKKPISQEKVVAKLKYKKEDTELGIVSLNPVNILAAKEVWVYNTKNRKLSQYKATGESGLGVKGTTLTDFSTESVEKTLRKPAESLAEFKKASKVKLRTFLKDLSTAETMCNGRLNEHHVILRIDK